jgi:uncharacterized membrane protein
MYLMKAAKRDHWMAAGSWLFYTVVFGALPFWGLAALLWLTAAQWSAEYLVKDGQLVVYAAGLLAASIPVMQKEIKDSPFKHPKWFLGGALLVIAFSALIFGAITIDPTRFRMGRLVAISGTLTFVSVILGFFTELVSEVRSDPDLRAVRDHQVSDLGESVRRKVQVEDR